MIEEDTNRMAPGMFMPIKLEAEPVAETTVHFEAVQWNLPDVCSKKPA